MKNLLRKDWLVSRWVHIAALVFGLVLVPIGLRMPHALAFVALFCQIIYTHLMFSINQQTVVSKADNLLLNALPVTRTQSVDSKYLFSIACAIGYASYLCIVLLGLAAFGVLMPMPIIPLWIMMSTLGVVYHVLLMPLAYLNSRYAAFASMLVYLAVIILPQRIGKGASGEKITGFFTQVGRLLGGWAIPALLFVGLFALAAVSLTISRNLYRRAEF